MSSPRWRSCPSCRALLDPKARSCQYCGASLDGAVEVRPRGLSPKDPAFRHAPVCTTVAILLFAIYAAQLTMQMVFYDETPVFRGIFEMFAPSNRAHVLFMGSASPEASWLSNLSSSVLSTFLHGGLIHIGFNLSAFAVLGRRIEAIMGSAFAMVLIGLGSFAGVLAPMLQDGMHIGFSGIVCAFLGAVLIHARASGDLAVTSLAKHWTIMMAIWSLLPGISWAGHAAGFVIGAIVTSLWIAPLARPLRTYFGRRIASGAAILFLLACAAVHLREVVPAFTYRKALLMDLLMARIHREVSTAYSDRAWSEAAQSDLLALGSLPSAWIPVRDALALHLQELSSAERGSAERRANAQELANISERWSDDLPQYLNHLSGALFVQPLAWRRNSSTAAY